MTPEYPDTHPMTRREARAIERSAVVEARRTQRTAAAVERRGARATTRTWGARRAVGAVVGGVAALGILAASIAPVVTSQVAEASQDPRATTYAVAADEAQLFAASAEGGTIAALSAVTYEAELRTPEPEPEPEPAAVPDEGDGEGDANEGSAPAPYQPPAPYTGGGSPAEWMSAAGIAESDWGYVDYIVTRESGWDPNATNPSSGACGLVQMYPCNKAGVNSRDPVANLAWANSYAIGRYGSWAGAHAFWTANHWW